MATLFICDRCGGPVARPIGHSTVRVIAKFAPHDAIVVRAQFNVTGAYGLCPDLCISCVRALLAQADNDMNYTA